MNTCTESVDLYYSWLRWYLETNSVEISYTEKDSDWNMFFVVDSNYNKCSKLISGILKYDDVSILKKTEYIAIDFQENSLLLYFPARDKILLKTKSFLYNLFA